MKKFKLHFFLSLFLIGSVCASYAQTDSAEPVEQPGWFKKAINGTVNTFSNIYDNGRLSLLLSGYAYHGRKTYTSERISEFNEKAWGLGGSKVLRDEKDNEEALQLLVLSDSHKKPQINAVYSYQWMLPLGTSFGKSWEAGLGYTAGLFMRRDMFGGLPFPAALPLFSVGTRDTKIISTYIPRISANKGNGDVLYVVLRIGL
jgi:lipid IVA palmitoyltransferase